MSSILRALKKLESEPRHLEKTQRVDHKYISLAGPQRRSSAFRPLLLFIGGGIACGMVLLTGWWFMYERVQPTAPPIQKSSNPAGTMDTPITEPQTTVSMQPEIPSPVAPGQDQPVVSAAPVDSQTEPVTPGPADAADASAILIPDETPIIETPPVLDQSPAGQSSFEPTAQEEIIATAAVLPEAPAEKEPQIPLLSDPDVKLQSISWSQKPSNRLAVISNRIVREGETASGYVIRTINKDDVILSQNGEQWRINFRTR